MPRKKIAFIGQKGYPSAFSGTSGVELYVEQKATSLARQGNHVICYSRKWATSPHQQTPNIHIRTLPSWNTKYLDAITHSFLATLHALFVERVDEVWYQGIGPGAFGVITKLLGVTTILTIHTLDWKRKKWGRTARFILRMCERFAVRSADTIYVVSKQLQQYVASVYHKEAIVDRLALPTLPKPNKTKAGKLLRKLGAKPSNYILFMGRFVPEKRIEWVIRAFRRLRTPNMRLILTGGESHTGEYERRVRRLADGDPHIRFLGFVFGKEKSILLAYAKFLVLPSSVEGFPVVVTEALQYNTPCLVPNFLKGEYPRGKPVYYFRHRSYENFSEAFKRLAKPVTS